MLDSFVADQVYYFLSILKNSSYLSLSVFFFFSFFLKIDELQPFCFRSSQQIKN